MFYNDNDNEKCITSSAYCSDISKYENTYRIRMRGNA